MTMRRFGRVAQLAWTTSVQAPASRRDPRAPPNDKFAVQYTLAHKLHSALAPAAASAPSARALLYRPPARPVALPASAPTASHAPECITLGCGGLQPRLGRKCPLPRAAWAGAAITRTDGRAYGCLWGRARRLHFRPLTAAARHSGSSGVGGVSPSALRWPAWTGLQCRWRAETRPRPTSRGAASSRLQTLPQGWPSEKLPPQRAGCVRSRSA